jgi:hypothetical protein
MMPAHPIRAGTAALIGLWLGAGCLIEKRWGECADLDPCGDHGTCDDSGGEIACQCDPGYQGPACSACATEHHSAGDGSCVADETCAGVDCGATARCALVDGGRVRL